MSVWYLATRSNRVHTNRWVTTLINAGVFDGFFNHSADPDNPRMLVSIYFTTTQLCHALALAALGDYPGTFVSGSIIVHAEGEDHDDEDDDDDSEDDEDAEYEDDPAVNLAFGGLPIVNLNDWWRDLVGDA